MVMAVFAYIFHQSFVVAQSISVDTIYDQVVLCSIISVYDLSLSIWRITYAVYCCFIDTSESHIRGTGSSLHEAGSNLATADD